MSEKNKELARRWFDEVWNQRHESAIDAMFHPEGKAHGIPGSQAALEGPEAYKENYRTFLRAFPDARITVDQIVADEHSVAVRWTATMTHLGDGLGFPATQKPATLRGSTFLMVKDGMFTEGWNQMDFQALISQLQAESPSAKPAASRSAAHH